VTPSLLTKKPFANLHVKSCNTNVAYFILRPLAQSDIAETYAFMAQRSVDDAEHWLSSVEEQCQMLAEMPEMGRQRYELPGKLRSFLVGKYILFYRPITDGVEIVRVVHGSRDIEKLFE
jgi:toxin ParE1/3/4